MYLVDNFGLRGTFPDGLHYFEHLEELSLRNDTIQGPLPKESLSLTRNLTVLDLAYQTIGGSFFDAFDACSAIENVNLDSNALEGPLQFPTTADSTIQTLVARWNPIGGSIPPSIGTLISLTILDLGATSLTGSLPTALYTLRSLEQLSLGGNSLSGPLSKAILGMSHLKTVSFDRNALAGPLPTFPSSIESLDLLGCRFFGTIPESFYDIPNIERLLLTRNQLSGTISTRIGLLSSLEFLSLENNNFTGTIPSIVESLSNIQTADFSKNNLVGSLNMCGVKNLKANCLPDANARANVDCLCCTWCCNSAGDICYAPPGNE